MSYRASRPIPFQSREMPYQFRASKALLGLGMLRRGLGDMQSYDSYLGLENCGAATTVADQFACSQRNIAKENSGAYQNDPCSPHNVDYSNPATIPAQCGGPVQTTVGNTYNPPTYTPPAYTAPSAPTYNPRLSFTSSRGGSTLYPDDTWSISITGAPPNQPVSVLGVHPDGGSATQGYGNTDGAGNWQLQGTITADMVGNWKEIWSVGGTQVGQFAFTVAQPQVQQTQLPQLPKLPAATVPSTTVDAGFSFSSIPWWGWALAGLGGVMLLGGGHGR